MFLKGKDHIIIVVIIIVVVVTIISVWLAKFMEHTTLDFRVVGSSPMLNIEIT